MRLSPRPCLRVLLWLGYLAIVAASCEAIEFRLSLDPSVAKQPLSGRLFVFLSQRHTKEPRLGPDWFNPEPFFGQDCQDFEPGTSRVVGAQAVGYPETLNKLPAGRYRVQAVLHHSLDSPHPSKGAGNLYSRVQEIQIDPKTEQVIDIGLDQVVAAAAFPRQPWIHEVVVKSDMLSKFHGREVMEHVAVVLPESYDKQPQVRYPVVYSIPGFGGSHFAADRYTQAAPKAQPGEVDFIRVMLNGQCAWGHHVYADSETNGPRGRALVEELIPTIDAKYRTIPLPTARFVTGHSSGGWSSLWLQVAYPDTFGGVWSTSPDPVDFRDFQRIDLYAAPTQNMYVDPQGQRRPIARYGTKPCLWFDNFTRMDDALGRGGQLRSFEAAFSPLDEHGLPRKLWNRETGVIDPAVAQAWQKYDVRLKLQREWPTLGPKVAGKLHIITGSLDTFYLEGAVDKLAATLDSLGSDASIEIVPGKNHSNVLTSELYARLRQQMSNQYLKHHGKKRAAVSP